MHWAWGRNTASALDVRTSRQASNEVNTKDMLQVMEARRLSHIHIHIHFVRQTMNQRPIPSVDDTMHSRAESSQGTSLRTPRQAIQNKIIV